MRGRLSNGFNRSVGTDSARILLGLTLSVILAASVVPATYAAETFRTFEGSTYIEVPNSPGLQLDQFTLEAKFRISDNHSERGYLISKAASDDGNVHLDHNYALYITKLNKIGGGFKASDGAYYYVYSEAFSLGAWHVAKLVYDGTTMRLFLDGVPVSTTAIGKDADNSEAGSLRIGTNAQKLDNFFVGDLDYVKVMDRSTYKVQYYNGFDTGTSPPPPPPPPDENDAPVAADDTSATGKNASVKVSVLANDNDPDGDALAIIWVTDPPHGSKVKNADGTITYTPDTGYVGTDSFSYRISDGEATDDGTVAVTVTDTAPPPPPDENNPPVANNDSYATLKNNAGSLNVLVNDSDPDGDALGVVSVTDPPGGVVTFTAAGMVTYTPNTGFVGSDSFTYKISDGELFDTATVSVTVSDNTTPPPPTGTDCSEIPMHQLRGVAFMDPVLTRKEKGGTFSAPSDYVSESMQRFKSYGFNLVRVPYYWESYVYNPTDFMNELELIAKTAQANNVCVVFDNHHWFTSSYWNTDIGKSGTAIGFPSFVVKSFPSKATYYETAGPFWEALLSNTLVIDGKKIWDVQWDFMSKVINKVDGYSSVAGYEILNEPHLWSKDQYDKLGNYNTYLAQKIRSISDKKIVFDRETTKEFMRDPTMEYKIVPRGVDKLVYGPHLYTPPTAGSGGEKQLNQIKKWKVEWGVEIMIGEFSAHTQPDMDAFLKGWKDAGFGWTYWKWSRATGTGEDHLGNVVYESDSVAKTEALKMLLASYAKIY